MAEALQKSVGRGFEDREVTSMGGMAVTVEFVLIVGPFPISF